jgi:hypothetical protein
VEENTAAFKHGGRAVVSLRQRQREIAEQLVSIVPGFAVSDEPAVLDLALAMAREESMLAAHEEVSEKARSDLQLYAGAVGEVLRPLHDQLDKNLTRKAALYQQLAMTPRSRIDLGLQAVRARAVAQDSDLDFDIDSLSPRQRELVYAAHDAFEATLREVLALPPGDEQPVEATEPDREAQAS